MPSAPTSGASVLRMRPAVLAGLVLVAALSRLLPHPPNFTPVGTVALFGGAYFTSRAAAVLVPLGAMLLSDLVFELVAGTGFGPITPLIYACIAAASWLGRRLQNRVRVSSVTAGSLAAATLFFLVVNAALWAAGELYPRTGEGLLACYVAAIPFFGNMLAGHAVYGLILFGGFELLQRRYPVLRAVPST